MKNPFSLKIVAHPDHFCNRKKEMDQLISYASSDGNTVIYSPRRFGKTSLVCQVQQRLKKAGFMTIYIDLFGLSSADNIAKRIARGLYAAIYEEKTLLQKAVSIIKTHRPVLRPDETGISISAESVSLNLSGTELLDKTMAEFGEFIDSGKKKINIVLDEFQEITEIRDRDIEGVLRAHIQQQQASYFFVGSRRRVLLEMFNQRRRPFFQSAFNFELHKLPHDELTDFISKRFDAGGKHCSLEMAGLIAGCVEDHPYYVQKLCFFCYELSGRTVTRKDVDAAFVELIQGEGPVFEALVQGLAPQQIALLRAVARDPSKSIMSMGYMRKHNLKSIGGIQSAARKLEQLDHIERQAGTPDASWHVVDPLFGRWLAS
jgi:hypothetical protein